MKKNAKETALSAVACAFSTLGLTVGTLYSPMLFTGYLIACLCMMLPLSKGYFKGAALCFAATNVLTLLFNGFNFFDTLPYTLFFGLHPLVNELQARLHKRSAQKKARAKVGGNGGDKNGEIGENGGDNCADISGEKGGTAAEKEGVATDNRNQSAPGWEVDWDAPAESGAKKAAPYAKEAEKNTGRKIFATDVLFGVFKTAWFDAAMFFVWKAVFSANTAIPFIDEHILPVLLIGGSLFFIVYDFLMFRMRKSVNFLIGKYVGKR